MMRRICVVLLIAFACMASSVHPIWSQADEETTPAETPKRAKTTKKTSKGTPSGSKATSGKASSGSKAALRLRLNRLRNHLLEVNKVDEKSLTLREAGQSKYAPQGSRPQGNWTDVIPGTYVGLSPAPDFQKLRDVPDSAQEFAQSHLFRVDIKQVKSDGAIVASVGDEAAKGLKAGDRIFLFYPPGASSAQVKNVPDWISLAATRGDSGNAENGADNDAQKAAFLAQSKNNLKQISLALHNFQQTFNSFPPAVVYGPDGKPWHSWRVLILPYLDQRPLFEQYKLGEPWDSPNNIKLLSKMPSVYGDPIYGENKDYFTHYAAIVGDGTAFPSAGLKSQGPGQELAQMNTPEGRKGTTTLHNFTDGTSAALLIGSVSPQRKIPWMKPEDVKYTENFPEIGAKDGFAAPYEGGTSGVFSLADGVVVQLSNKYPVDSLRKLLTIADGQLIPDLPVQVPSASQAGQPPAGKRPYPPVTVFVLTPDKAGSYRVAIESEELKFVPDQKSPSP